MTAAASTPTPARLTVSTETEDDDRWIAQVEELPGVLVYGPTRGDAIAAAKALALRVVAERIEHGEAAPDLLAGVAFVDATT